MRAVIFDLGEVLVHYDHLTSMAAIAARSAVSAEDARTLYAAVGHDLNIGALDAEALHQYYQEQAGFQGDLEDFLTAFAAGLTRLDQPLAYALELQRRPDVTVGVISNTNEAHVAWLDENLPELEIFDLVIMSNEVSVAKPEAEIYTLALELLGITAEQAIFVDDRVENVVAAQALGMAGILQQDWALTRPAIERWLATGALVDGESSF